MTVPAVRPARRIPTRLILARRIPTRRILARRILARRLPTRLIPTRLILGRIAGNLRRHVAAPALSFPFVLGGGSGQNGRKLRATEADSPDSAAAQGDDPNQQYDHRTGDQDSYHHDWSFRD